MNALQQALNTLRNAKRSETAAEDVQAAMAVVNDHRNAPRIARLMRAGFTREEAEDLLYQKPNAETLQKVKTGALKLGEAPAAPKGPKNK